MFMQPPSYNQTDNERNLAPTQRMIALSKSDTISDENEGEIGREASIFWLMSRKCNILFRT